MLKLFSILTFLVSALEASSSSSSSSEYSSSSSEGMLTILPHFLISFEMKFLEIIKQFKGEETLDIKPKK
jgi:hypothetical protein